MSATGLAESHPSPWLDDAPPPRPPVAGAIDADVAIVGAGFTGLWTALSLVEHDPALRVAVIEASIVGHGASGRNGGFVDPSLTHGPANGHAHFGDEMQELTRLGVDNYRGLVADVARYGIACDLDEVGVLHVATALWQLHDLAADVDLFTAAGEPTELLDADATRAELDSPTYLAALHRPQGGALVNPGALARGLADAAEARGVSIHEHSPVVSLRRDGDGVRLQVPGGSVSAGRAVLATNAYSHQLARRTGRHFVPVYDYVLMTAPLTGEQLARVGWQRRQGVADSANQFHYYRLTADNRILWGGYDAIYRFGSRVGPRYDVYRPTHERLETHFRATFPQLDDVAFERRWGGPIATTTHFSVTFGELHGGRVVYALGYTGLGVAATRFAAQVLRDRMFDPGSALLKLRLTSTHPFPFPPEPLRWLGVNLTRRAIARADSRDGRRGPWLRTLDRFGIGFDS